MGKTKAIAKAIVAWFVVTIGLEMIFTPLIGNQPPLNLDIIPGTGVLTFWTIITLVISSIIAYVAYREPW